MRRSCWARSGLAALAAGVAAAAAPALSLATELCVVCAEPQQTYRCRVENAQGRDEAIKLYCVIRTAKDGGHKSCAVAAQSDAPCEGALKTYSADGLGIPNALRQSQEQWRQEQAHVPLPAGAPRLTQPQPKQGQPKTLVQMTGKTGKKIGKLGKKTGVAAVDAGSAVGRAARFTLHCLKSLFRDCSRSER